MLNFFNTNTPFPSNDIPFHQPDDRGDLPRFRRYLEAVGNLPTPQAMPIAFTHGACCFRSHFDEKIYIGVCKRIGNTLTCPAPQGGLEIHPIEGWLI